ncbi:CD302 antigen [Salminus brasiliensis]|uniref:CD302 antigen n=1 Tax=Salminus brasiliensis TaxID=930266 RepID=UPI003B83916E
MESSGWHLASLLCVAILTFLCHSTQGQANGDCPADGRTWVAFGNNCYCFVHGEEDIPKRYTIEKAKDMCKDFGLLTVHSAEENKFIVDYSPNVWKGSVNVWLGMYYSIDDNQFKWKDESPLTFKNWEEGGMEDLEVPPVDTCVTLHVASGMWESVSCTEQQENGVVCETPQKAAPVKKNGSPVLSALVILSVILILGISAFVWFLQQRSNSGSFLLPSFEYHPPFKAPSADQTCLVEAEEIS